MPDRKAKLEKMLEGSPDDPFLHFALAMEHVKAEDWPAAEATFDRALELDEAYVPAWFQKGLAQEKAGDTAAARATLQRGIEVAQRTGDHHAAAEMQDALLMMGT